MGWKKKTKKVLGKAGKVMVKAGKTGGKVVKGTLEVAKDIAPVIVAVASAQGESSGESDK